MVKEAMAGHSPNSGSKTPLESNQPSVSPVSQRNEVTEMEKEFLIQVWKYPLNGTVQKYKRIGLSRRIHIIVNSATLPRCL